VPASHSNTTDPALFAQQPLQTQAALEPSAIEWLLLCCVHDQQLFREMRTLIQPHHFKIGESVLRLVYEAMCLSMDRYNGITYETLVTIIGDTLAQDPSIVLVEAQADVLYRKDEHGLLWQFCHPNDVATHITNKALSRDLLRQLAMERTVVEPLRHVMNPGVTRGVPSELGTFLSVINTQNARISTLNDIPEANIAPDVGTQLKSANVFVKTGVPWFDNVFGGQRPGDCNGLIGPTGGGKTTLAVHMAVAGVNQAWAESLLTNKQMGITVFITAEESAEKLRPRIWSAFFKIPKAKTEIIDCWQQFTQPGQLDPYELKMQQEQSYKLSEIERYQLYVSQLRTGLRVLDLSGSNEFPNAGRGYIDEIVSYVSRYEVPIRTIFIDYAGIFCERHLAATGKEADKNYRFLLKTFGDRCRQELAARFNCTVWVLHQLKGSVNKARPTVLMHHSEAGESADFANNMAVCGCLGVADTHTGCRRLNWSKCRYVAADKITPPTLRIDSQFALMEDVSNLFTAVDSGQFMSAEDQRQIRGTEGLARHQHIGGPPNIQPTGLLIGDVDA